MRNHLVKIAITSLATGALHWGDTKSRGKKAQICI